MNHLKKFVILICIFFFSVAISYSQDSALRVDIKPELTSVKNGEEFSVMTKVINTSHKDQSLHVWSCSYSENWVVDNDLVLISGQVCHGNGVMEVLLKPGEAYEKKLSLKSILASSEGFGSEKVTFRLGFKTFVDGPNNKLPIVWSNPITVDVKE